jgi:putative transposase
MAIADAVRQIGVTEPTYYRWRKQYGGMNRDQLKRLKELETESEPLRRHRFEPDGERELNRPGFTGE